MKVPPVTITAPVLMVSMVTSVNAMKGSLVIIVKQVCKHIVKSFYHVLVMHVIIDVLIILKSRLHIRSMD